MQRPDSTVTRDAQSLQPTPVHRLPPELLCEIFIDLVSMSETEWSEAATIIPHSVAHVCVRWRAVAHGCAQLWTTISSRANPATIDAQLRYSSGLPLRIVYRGGGPGSKNLPREWYLAPFVERLRSLAHRWQSINLTASCSVLSSIPPINALPMLSRAILDMNDRYDGKALDFMTNATTLRELYLDIDATQNIALHTDRLHLPLFPSLTLLNITVKEYTVLGWLFPAIVQCAPTLVDLVIAVEDCMLSYDPLQRGDWRRTRSFPALKTLDLAGRMHGLLPYIDAPHLRSLTLRNNSMNGDPFPSLHRLLTWHAYVPPITSLELREIGVADSSAFLVCLPLMVDLRYLAVSYSEEPGQYLINIRRCAFTESVLNRLADGDEAPLLPALVSLDVYFPRSTRKESDALLRFVYLRELSQDQGTRAVAALQFVKIQTAFYKLSHGLV
ncbi:hypothetical protein BD626DRAFT_187523 [Schizophyllum amplum]|uniref:Uncharacterized protein n=1 Tax=Schizophyllum amplum TaxID=97359 RepID=A0A550C019_9AGAR|nr:hypothetical protein BD626DRAFT_187523 [Auriculariopsis ampla]